MVAQLLPGRVRQLLHGLRHGHGVENVIPEEGAERDMPPVPEFGDRPGEEGAAEVFRHGNPENLPHAHHRVHRAGKVHVQLDGIAQRCQSNDPAGKTAGVGKYRLHEGVQSIRHHQLFHQSEEKPLQTGRQVLIANGLTVPESVRRLGIAADGPLHDLREEGQEQCHPQQVPVRGNFLVVHVKEVGDCLQGIEGNTDGHQVLRHVQGQSKQRVHVPEGKARVFQGQEHPQICQRTQRQNPAQLALIPAFDLLPPGTFCRCQFCIPLFQNGIHPKPAAPDDQDRPQQPNDPAAADKPEKAQTFQQKRIFFKLPGHQRIEDQAQGQVKAQKRRRKEGSQVRVLSRLKQGENPRHAQPSS